MLSIFACSGQNFRHWRFIILMGMVYSGSGGAMVLPVIGCTLIFCIPCLEYHYAGNVEGHEMNKLMVNWELPTMKAIAETQVVYFVREKCNFGREFTLLSNVRAYYLRRPRNNHWACTPLWRIFRDSECSSPPCLYCFIHRTQRNQRVRF